MQEAPSLALPPEEAAGVWREALLLAWFRLSVWVLSDRLDCDLDQVKRRMRKPQGQRVRRKGRAEPQPLSGREREGGAFLRKAASLAFPDL